MSDIAEPAENAEIEEQTTTEASRDFAAKYWNNPYGFVHECFNWKPGEEPTPYQEQVLQNLPTRKRVSVRGPHGLGKTAMNSWIIIWFALTRDAAGVDWKVVTTAGAWRQLTKFLWPEVHKWVRRLNWEKIGREPFDSHELLSLSLKLKTGEAFAVASDNPDLIEGAHADQLMYVFDESKAIHEATFDAAEGAFSNAGANDKTDAFAVAMSTPGEPLGRFYEIQARRAGFEDWWVRHVRFEEVVAAHRSSWVWAEQRARQWGEGSAIYQNKVLGEFASNDANGVIPLAFVEAANLRWHEWAESLGKDPQENWQTWLDRYKSETPLPFDQIGMDVGDQGDATILAFRAGQVVTYLERCPKDGLMANVGRLYSKLAKSGGKVVVDVIGIGAGVVSRLRELKAEAQGRGGMNEHGEPVADYTVVAYNAASASTDKDDSGELGFINQRAESWWKMREALDPANNSQLALPPDDTLIGDLIAPSYKMNSGGRYQIESKDDIRKRLGRSTDAADAVIMACHLKRDPGDILNDFLDAKLKRLQSRR